MKIFVRIKPRSKSQKITKIDDTYYDVYVHEPAYDGKANRAVIQSLSKYFDIRRAKIEIVKGFKSKNKIIEIIQ
ncbi:DUF167 domain-containing protein [Patescibacteria group bacterium]